MGGQRSPGSAGVQTSEAIDSGTGPRISMPAPTKPDALSASPTAPSNDAPMAGGVVVAIGQPSVVRIPIPGTNGLAIELSPRGWTPRGGSTSTLFFQDITGKRHLRLDYGYNVKTKTIDYHWNEGKKVGTGWGLPDHLPAGRSGAIAYNAAKYFKYAGRVVMVAGIALDVVSIAQADRPMRRATEVVAGWVGAWVGCQWVGAGGAAAGSVVPALGTAAGGISGCIIGGIAGYAGFSQVGGVVYDWADATFTPLPETDAP